MRSPIITLAQNRSKLMSELASNLAEYDINQDEASLVGILSLIDVITESPLEAVLKELKVSSSIKEGLLKHEGPLGRLLELTIGIKTLDKEKANRALSQLNISNEDINASILRSYNI